MSAVPPVGALPRVFCVIPVYNAAGTVLRALRSLLQQRGVCLRVVVVDHGSRDGSARLVRGACDRDGRVELLRLARGPQRAGAAVPLNAGLRRVRQLASPGSSAWFLRLDADDFLASEEVLSGFLQDGGRARLIAGRLTFFREETRCALRYGSGEAFRSRERLLGGGAYAFAHHASLVGLSLLEAVAEGDGAVYLESLVYGEDLDLTLRLLRRVDPAELRLLEGSLLFKALDGESLSNTTRAWRILADMQRVFARNPELPRGLLRRLACDLALRPGGSLLAPLRRRLGQPARQVSYEEPVAYARVAQRMAELAGEELS